MLKVYSCLVNGGKKGTPPSNIAKCYSLILWHFINKQHHWLLSCLQLLCFGNTQSYYIWHLTIQIRSPYSYVYKSYVWLIGIYLIQLCHAHNCSHFHSQAYMHGCTHTHTHTDTYESIHTHACAFTHGNMYTYEDNSVVQKTFLLCLCISILISPYLKLDQKVFFLAFFT